MKQIFSKITENLNLTGNHRVDSRLVLEHSLEMAAYQYIHPLLEASYLRLKEVLVK